MKETFYPLIQHNGQRLLPHPIDQVSRNLEKYERVSCIHKVNDPRYIYIRVNLVLEYLYIIVQ